MPILIFWFRDFFSQFLKFRIESNLKTMISIYLFIGAFLGISNILNLNFIIGLFKEAFYYVDNRFLIIVFLFPILYTFIISKTSSNGFQAVFADWKI